jgi:hypothetical protein
MILKYIKLNQIKSNQIDAHKTAATGGPSSGPFSKQDDAIPWLNTKGAMNEVQQ